MYASAQELSIGSQKCDNADDDPYVSTMLRRRHNKTEITHTGKEGEFGF